MKRKNPARRRGFPVVPVILLLGFAVLAVFAPYVTPFEPGVGGLHLRFVPPFGVDHDGAFHLLGTDNFGRDIFTRIAFGTRVSVTIATASVVVAAAFGSVLGMIAGYYGGWIDGAIMRLVDIMLSIPMILIAIVMAAVIGPSITNVIIAITLLVWPRYSRQVRGETLVLRHCEFIDYARVIDVKTPVILMRHVLPNVLPSIIVLTTWQFGFVVLSESSLSFLGAGVPLALPAWGAMVSEGTRYLTTNWWLAIIPSVALALLVVSINVLGNWLRDRFDPSMSRT